MHIARPAEAALVRHAANRVAEALDLPRSHLNDIEKCRQAVSPERAARFAEVAGYSEARPVPLALRDMIHRGGLKLRSA